MHGKKKKKRAGLIKSSKYNQTSIVIIKYSASSATYQIKEMFNVKAFCPIDTYAVCLFSSHLASHVKMLAAAEGISYVATNITSLIGTLSLWM